MRPLRWFLLGGVLSFLLASATFASAGIEALGARWGATAVWTGKEMLVWGGADETDYLGSGLRYDPATDRWAATSSDGAPSPRIYHTAVWTGTEMIVWGGFDGDWLDDGARYDPVSDHWTPLSSAGAPSGRAQHTTVWTGTEMIVWGGADGLRVADFLDTGSRYDPASDRWTATSTDGAPKGRSRHTAVWTGTEMIVWGGRYKGQTPTGTGGIYDPASDSWRPVSEAGAPASRQKHTAVWTGNEMIVFGGSSTKQVVKVGGRYEPASDTWIPMAEAPRGAVEHSAVWTGSEMLLWGGRRPGLGPNGLRYSPSTDSWRSIRGNDAPIRGTFAYSCVWTGDHMIVWGGRISPSTLGLPFNTGGVYDPATDTWTPTSTEGPAE